MNMQTAFLQSSGWHLCHVISKVLESLLVRYILKWKHDYYISFSVSLTSGPLVKVRVQVLTSIEIVNSNSFFPFLF